MLSQSTFSHLPQLLVGHIFFIGDVVILYSWTDVRPRGLPLRAILGVSRWRPGLCGGEGEMASDVGERKDRQVDVEERVFLRVRLPV